MFVVHHPSFPTCILYIIRSQVKENGNVKETNYVRADPVQSCGLKVMQSVHGSEKMLGLACKPKQQVSNYNSHLNSFHSCKRYTPTIL